MQNIEVSQGVPSAITKESSGKKFPIRIEGHRGAGHLEPENSLKAFKKAIELGIDGVEFDVWLTKDLIPIVAHGKKNGLLEFQKGVKEFVTEIDSINLSNYTLKNGEKIPTLAEVLDVCKDKVNLNIEIKDKREEAIVLVLILLQERNMFGQITFSSFNHKHRVKLTSEIMERKIDSQVTFGFLMKIRKPNFPDYEHAKPGDSINIDIRYLEKHREECLLQIKKAQERMVKVKFWFPMDYQEEHMFYEDLIGLDVDTIITNKPITMIEYFQAQSIKV